jgi:hypothetical protein
MYIWHNRAPILHRPPTLSTNGSTPQSTSGASKTISKYVCRKPCTYLAPTLTLPPNRRKLDSTWPTSLGVPTGASKMNSEAMVCSEHHAPILRQDYHYLQTDRNELPLKLCYLVVSSGASKTIYEPIVRLAQTMHLPCTDTNTISK